MKAKITILLEGRPIEIQRILESFRLPTASVEVLVQSEKVKRPKLPDCGSMTRGYKGSGPKRCSTVAMVKCKSNPINGDDIPVQMCKRHCLALHKCVSERDR